MNENTFNRSQSAALIELRKEQQRLDALVSQQAKLKRMARTPLLQLNVIALCLHQLARRVVSVYMDTKAQVLSRYDEELALGDSRIKACHAAMKAHKRQCFGTVTVPKPHDSAKAEPATTMAAHTLNNAVRKQQAYKSIKLLQGYSDRYDRALVQLANLEEQTLELWSRAETTQKESRSLDSSRLKTLEAKTAKQRFKCAQMLRHLEQRRRSVPKPATVYIDGSAFFVRSAGIADEGIAVERVQYLNEVIKMVYEVYDAHLVIDIEAGQRNDLDIDSIRAEYPGMKHTITGSRDMSARTIANLLSEHPDAFAISNQRLKAFLRYAKGSIRSRIYRVEINAKGLRFPWKSQYITPEQVHARVLNRMHVVIPEYTNEGLAQ